MFIPSDAHTHSLSPMATAMAMYHVHSLFPYDYESSGHIRNFYYHPIAIQPHHHDTEFDLRIQDDTT